MNELRSSYEGRINDLKLQLELVTEQRDFFQGVMLRRAGIIQDEVKVEKVEPRINRTRETPGQIAARMQSEARIKYWESERKKAEERGEIPTVSRTEG